MIGVEGQYIFKFSIGDFKDFIGSQDLNYFLVIEECGNILPTWETSFTTTNPDVLSVLNEGNNFEVSYGSSFDSITESAFLISNSRMANQGHGKYHFVAKGIYSKLPYITVSNKFISDKKSGIEVLISKAKKYFKIDGNITKSNDEMHWIQPNITDKAFIDQLWLHSYISDSFTGISIGADGKFRIKDIKKASTEDPKFKFTPRPEKPKELAYEGDYVLNSDAGFINCWMGYGREKLIHDLEKSTYKNINESFKPFLALTPTLARNSEVEKRSALTGVHNENTHSNYWNAALRNVTGLAIFSREGIILSFSNIMIDIHPLDLVMFKDMELGSDNQSSEYFSGLYLVGRVSKSVSNKSFTTTLQLFRESLNSLKGDLF